MRQGRLVLTASQGWESSMSVERIKRKREVVWRVRWCLQWTGTLARSSGCSGCPDCLTRRSSGESGWANWRRWTLQISLAEFADERRRLHAVSLAPKTQDVYSRIYDTHLLDRVGGWVVSEVRPVHRRLAPRRSRHIGGWASRCQEGASILRQGRLAARGAGLLGDQPDGRGAKADRETATPRRAAAPSVVEQTRGLLREQGMLRDATLIGTLAYGGLRPQEALGVSVGEPQGAHAPHRPRAR